METEEVQSCWATFSLSLNRYCGRLRLGPMVNLLLALVWWHLGDCGWVNLVIGMVNLAPFPNSDGLRVYGLWKGWP